MNRDDRTHFLDNVYGNLSLNIGCPGGVQDVYLSDGELHSINIAGMFVWTGGNIYIQCYWLFQSDMVGNFTVNIPDILLDFTELYLLLGHGGVVNSQSKMFSVGPSTSALMMSFVINTTKMWIRYQQHSSAFGTRGIRLEIIREANGKFVFYFMTLKCMLYFIVV